MKALHYIIFLGLLVIFSCGQKVARDKELYSTIKPGVTTQEEVKLHFGKPMIQRVSSSGEEEWIYQYVPFICLGQSYGVGATYILTIRFDKTGTVKEYLRSEPRE
jgi:hypothetical protein